MCSYLINICIIVIQLLLYELIIELPFEKKLVFAQQSLHFNALGYFGGNGNGHGEFTNARAIADDIIGQIYVVDTGNNRILKFSSQGTLVQSLGEIGWGKDQFDHPIDLSTSLGLDIYIADSYNQRILRYDKDLNYISQFTPDDVLNDALRFGFPLAIEMSIHGDLFFIDGENRRIVRISRLGTPDQIFGGFADTGNLIEEPGKICIGPNDLIYILDTKKPQVVIFDYYGNYVLSFGSDILKHPLGIAVDRKQRIFVADGELQQIVIFSSQGIPLGNLGPQILQLGQSFREPVDVVAGRKDFLYVLDRAGSRVFIFQETSE